jgi:excisionase family DNA binding protein
VARRITGKKPKPASDLLDIEEAAAFLSVTPRWMRRAVFEKRIPYYKIGGQLRWKRRDLEAYLNRQREEATW